MVAQDVTKRMVRSPTRPVVPALLVCAVTACDVGSPAQPATEPTADATVKDASFGPKDTGAVADSAVDVVVDGAAESAAPPQVVYRLCPDGMAPSFPSIFTQMFATASCGAGRSFDCHSTTGALPLSEGGTGSLLDFSLDAAAVYAELLGDGSGQPAVNLDGDAGGVVLRIAPGNADASLLYIKVSMVAASDPRYGKAMPPDELACPAVDDALRAWIDDGAAPSF
jgi:hypothetical protein